jgi:hypothetical protein
VTAVGEADVPWRWWVGMTLVAVGVFGYVFWLLLRWFG